MSPDLVALADEWLAELCRDHPIGYRPALVWKNYRVTAGQARYRDGVIVLSAILLDDEERLRITLRHEYAHLMAFQKHGRKGANHGPAWREAMRDLGLEPIVRHRYEVQRNQARQEVAYICKRCGAILLRKRRLPKRRKYVHAKCGGDLKFSHIQPITTAPSAP